MKISSTLNCTWMSNSARRSSSSIEITDAREDLFISPLKALPRGGMMIRSACGITTTRFVPARVMPMARDGGDTGADDLGEIGAFVDPEPDERRGYDAELEAELRQAGVDDDELHQDRRAAKHPEKERGGPAQQPMTRPAHQRGDHAEYQADGHRANREDK